MKKLSDEEIQKIVAENLPHKNLSDSDAENLRAYRLLFDALEKEPSKALSSDFADKVVEKIGYRNSLVETVKFYFYIVSLILLFFIVVLATFLFAEVPFSKELINFIDNYKEGIVFALVSVLVVQILDELLVKKRFSKFG